MERTSNTEEGDILFRLILDQEIKEIFLAIDDFLEIISAFTSNS